MLSYPTHNLKYSTLPPDLIATWSDTVGGDQCSVNTQGRRTGQKLSVRRTGRREVRPSVRTDCSGVKAPGPYSDHYNGPWLGLMW